MGNVSNVSNIHLFMMLLIAIFITTVIGVSFKKTKQIERFSNDSSKVTIEYFYTNLCTKCVKFKDQLLLLETDLKDYISSGNIKITKYDAIESDHYNFIRKERKVRKVPTLFIYDSSKSPQEYTGEFSAKSIRQFIDKNYGRILDLVEIEKPIIPESPPVSVTPPSPTPLPSPSNPPFNDCVSKAIKQNVDVYLRQQQNMKNKLNEMIRNIDNETEKFKNGLNSDVDKCMA